jgi:hypothetical protein
MAVNLFIVSSFDLFFLCLLKAFKKFPPRRNQVNHPNTGDCLSEYMTKGFQIQKSTSPFSPHDYIRGTESKSLVANGHGKGNPEPDGTLHGADLHTAVAVPAKFRIGDDRHLPFRRAEKHIFRADVKTLPTFLAFILIDDGWHMSSLNPLFLAIQ